MSTKEEHLLTANPIWRPWIFDRVPIVEKVEGGFLSVATIVAPIHASFDSGANIFEFSSLSARILGRNGAFSAGKGRYIGFQKIGAL
jgi:hypothetical protein